MLIRICGLLGSKSKLKFLNTKAKGTFGYAHLDSLKEESSIDIIVAAAHRA